MRACVRACVCVCLLCGYVVVVEQGRASRVNSAATRSLPRLRHSLTSALQPHDMLTAIARTHKRTIWWPRRAHSAVLCGGKLHVEGCMQDAERARACGAAVGRARRGVGEADKRVSEGGSTRLAEQPRLVVKHLTTRVVCTRPSAALLRRLAQFAHPRRDLPTSAPGLAHICARDLPTSAPGLITDSFGPPELHATTGAPA